MEKITRVAPHVGAWIETTRRTTSNGVRRSRPMWARGLKLLLQHAHRCENRSRPMWARGLKHEARFAATEKSKSRPMWARGLKLSNLHPGYSAQTVAPHVGAWIETILRCKGELPRGVAPHVGAWIETTPSAPSWRRSTSRPMWARGLKHLNKILVKLRISRAPCGRVD